MTSGGPFGQGKSAFTLTPTGAAGATFQSTVMRDQVPHPIPWVVHLGAWQGVNTTLRNATGMPSLQARITWSGGDAGGGSGSETVVVDYPTAGTILTVVAASIMVEVIGQMPGLGDSSVPPALSGWMSRGHASSRVWTPTLTGPVRLVNALASAVELVPPRARAFRVNIVGHGNGNITATQFSGDATPVTLAIHPVYDVTVYAQQYPPDASAAWIPLDCRAQVVAIGNASTVGAAQVATQFLLDLG